MAIRKKNEKLIFFILGLKRVMLVPTKLKVRRLGHDIAVDSLTLSLRSVRTGRGIPEKSWNFRLSFFRPGKS